MSVERAVDFIEGDSASGHAIPSTKPLFIEGRSLLPAENLRGAMVQITSNGWAIMLELEGQLGIGLYSQMTPDGARMAGQMLIKMAGEVDQLIAQQAAAAIEAARKAPPASSSEAAGGDKTP